MDEQIEQSQNQPERQLTKRERRQMRKEEKRQEGERAKRVQGKKNILVWAGVILLVAAGGFGIFRYLFSADEGEIVFDPTNSCITHAGGGMHIHPFLRIVINGERQDISANVGISAGCMRPLHTHDTTGKLHIEFPRHRAFTLGEFFKVWDRPFSSSQIFDYVADDTHTLTMTVNGELNTDYENLVFRDSDQIEIQYKAISE